MWISSQVYSDLSTKSDLGKLLTILQFYDPQILPGCDCCEDNGKLMADGHTWISNGKTYGKTRSQNKDSDWQLVAASGTPPAPS